MKGLVKVTPESLISITDNCCIYMNNFKLEDQSFLFHKRFSLFKLKTVSTKVYDAPFWYQYKKSLIQHMHKLQDMADQGDEIWLSELSYCHLLMLSKGDVNANPIYIMNY